MSPSLYRAGAGEQLVLLHGATGSWRHWRPVLADLVPHFEVIAPTLPGHADGPDFPLEAAPSVSRIADEVERQLDELEVGSAHLVGNSLGGALAIELAKRGRARSVLAISPAFGWELGSPHTARVARSFTRMRMSARLALPHIERLAWSAQARRIAFRDAMRHGNRLAPTEAADLVHGATQCALLDSVLRTGDKEALLPRDLDQVAAPVLLAWGELDRILYPESCSVRYRREIPGAEYQLLPAVGHTPMWDDPQLITDTIHRWIGRHTNAGHNQRAHADAGTTDHVLAAA